MKFSRLVVFLFIAVCAGLAWYFLPKKAAAKEPTGPRSVSVTVTAATQRDVPIWLSGLGTAQAFNKVTIRPRVSGVLDEINFTEGQAVKEGDVLARIDPRPYQSLLSQAKAKLAQTAAQLGNARIALDRVAKLIASGAESQQIYDQTAATLAQYEAQEKADAAAVQAAELDLDFTTVKAPIAGKTGVRLIDKGNLVTASQEGGLVVITQLQPISVIFTLSQDYLPALRQRMMADPSPLKAQALSDDGKVLAEGDLELIDNEIDPNSGTLKLKAKFSNTDLTLWPGQFITARVLVETRTQAVVVPTQAVQTGLNGPFVYIAKADKKVEVRQLKTGPRVDGITIIEEGLQADEQIVLDGQSKLQPGASITLQPSKP